MKSKKQRLASDLDSAEREKVHGETQDESRCCIHHGYQQEYLGHLIEPIG